MSWISSSQKTSEIEKERIENAKNLKDLEEKLTGMQSEREAHTKENQETHRVITHLKPQPDKAAELNDEHTKRHTT